jgi:hypothetical protein
MGPIPAPEDFVPLPLSPTACCPPRPAAMRTGRKFRSPERNGVAVKAPQLLVRGEVVPALSGFVGAHDLNAWAPSVPPPKSLDQLLSRPPAKPASHQRVAAGFDSRTLQKQRSQLIEKCSSLAEEQRIHRAACLETLDAMESLVRADGAAMADAEVSLRAQVESLERLQRRRKEESCTADHAQQTWRELTKLDSLLEKEGREQSIAAERLLCVEDGKECEMNAQRSLDLRLKEGWAELAACEDAVVESEALEKAEAMLETACPRSRMISALRWWRARTALACRCRQVRAGEAAATTFLRWKIFVAMEKKWRKDSRSRQLRKYFLAWRRLRRIKRCREVNLPRIFRAWHCNAVTQARSEGDLVQHLRISSLERWLVRILHGWRRGAKAGRRPGKKRTTAASRRRTSAGRALLTALSGCVTSHFFALWRNHVRQGLAIETLRSIARRRERRAVADGFHRWVSFLLLCAVRQRLRAKHAERSAEMSAARFQTRLQESSDDLHRTMRDADRARGMAAFKAAEAAELRCRMEAADGERCKISAEISTACSGVEAKRREMCRLRDELGEIRKEREMKRSSEARQIREAVADRRSKAECALERARVAAKKQEGAVQKAQQHLNFTQVRDRSLLESALAACSEYENLLVTKEDSIKRLDEKVGSAQHTLERLHEEMQELQRLSSEESLERRSRMRNAVSTKRILALRYSQVKARAAESTVILQEREAELEELRAKVAFTLQPGINSRSMMDAIVSKGSSSICSTSTGSSRTEPIGSAGSTPTHLETSLSRISALESRISSSMRGRE